MKMGRDPPLLSFSIKNRLSASFAVVRHVRYLCTKNQMSKDLHSLYLHHLAGMPIRGDALLPIVLLCSKHKDLAACKRIHSLLISAEVPHSFVDMFAQCGALLDANLMFSTMEEPNVHSWYAIISTHVALEETRAALILYFQMLDEGVKPSKSLYLCALNACSIIGALGHGRLIHCDILKNGLESGVLVQTNFVNFYSRCGNLEDARAVFEKISSKNIVSWGALIAGYVQHGRDLVALAVYEEMHSTGLMPDDSVFSCVLKACGSLGATMLGQLIHDKVVRQSLEGNVVLGNTLISMYTKCGTPVDAHKVFSALPKRTEVTWSAMFAGFAPRNDGLLALDLYWKMQQEGIKVNKFISSSILKAFGNAGALKDGRILHEQLIRIGYEADLVIGNGLIDMYARCGSIEDAHRLFEGLCDKDEISWGSIIAGCVQANANLVALELLERMQQEDKKGNNITFSCALQACAAVGAFKEGKVIHNQIVVQGVGLNGIVGSTLVDMYAKCGSLMEAWKVFEGLRHKTLASWCTLIDGFASNETYGFLALDLFQRMQDEGLLPNILLYSSALKACSTIGALQQGRVLHNKILCSDLDIDVIAGNILVDMYIKSGSIDGAHKVFDRLMDRDIVTWNSLIFGYVELYYYSSALDLYRNMQKNDIKPDRVTFLCTLKACGGVGGLEQGRFLHITLMKGDIKVDLSMRNALMDMYSKCGSIEDAEKVFADIHTPDLISWGTIFAGYAQHGNFNAVGHYLQNMRIQGVMADEGIFSSILAACRQAGQVGEAHRFFLAMREDPAVTPNMEHFNCMADLIARIGRLLDAQKFLESMPVQTDATGWMSLLTSCQVYGDINLGKKCFEQVILAEPDCAAGYMLMWSIYADAQQWDDAAKIRELSKRARVEWAEEENELVF